MNLTERGRWVLVYLPAFAILEAGLIVGGFLAFGAGFFQP
jgi:hypothetical protein